MMLDGTTLILPIAPGCWSPPRADAVIDGLVLVPKSELHITLIGDNLGRQLRAVFAEACLSRVIEAAFASQAWDFRRTGQQLLLRKPLGGEARSGVAHSIIELVDLPAMASFHHQLGRHLGRQLPVPPAHVTLYTAGRPGGIGIASPRRLRAFSVRRLPPPATLLPPDPNTFAPTSTGQG